MLGMDRTTLTASLKPLIRRRLVTLRSDATDRRIRRLALTAAGAAVLVAALPVWRREHAAIEGMLASDPERLRSDLRALGR
jgi:DNA-binding MarR family transcriptional regulator